MSKLNAFLLLAILVSSVFIVQARYRYRMINSELDVQKQESLRIKEETEKLSYEYDLNSKPNNVLQWATQNNMVEPKIENTIFAEEK
ncbi:MAG: Cell division protein FtsL [Pseudomonadota bacterium]|jgi:cell division protein FtsL